MELPIASPLRLSDLRVPVRVPKASLWCHIAPWTRHPIIAEKSGKHRTRVRFDGKPLDPRGRPSKPTVRCSNRLGGARSPCGRGASRALQAHSNFPEGPSLRAVRFRTAVVKGSGASRLQSTRRPSATRLLTVFFSSQRMVIIGAHGRGGANAAASTGTAGSPGTLAGTRLDRWERELSVRSCQACDIR